MARVTGETASASLEGIAGAAGVGIGTLYRHFPTRDALLEAAYRSEIEILCHAAPALLEQHPPDVGLALIAGVVAPMIEAGKAQRLLRDDVAVDDFIAVKGAVVNAAPDRARRLAVILVDGLRFRERG